MLERQQKAIGDRIEYYEVLASQLNPEDESRRNGVDLHLWTMKAGEFAIEIVTKDQFGNDVVAEAFDDRDHPEDLLLEPNTNSVVIPPFVVNDENITDEVLDQKFAHRIILPDLANSLHPVRSQE